MGTVAIQTQCCLSKTDDEWEDDDGDSAQEGTAVQLVDSVPWHERGGGTRADPPASPRPATNLSRSLSETTTIFAPPQQMSTATWARRA